ncbi:retrovirus-related pol polyprotein from transposon TNT 1-94 [Tanacetum coccineum]
MNKSNEKQKNHVDSSISYKRTVINSNSNTSCKTCNKCLISVNHDQCVVRSEMFVKQSPATKVWRVKQVKQVWKATGKLFTTIGHQWRPTGRLLPLGDQWPLTRNTPPKVLPTKQWKPTGRLLPLGRQCPLVRSTALKSDCMPADPQETIAPVVQIVLWYLDSGCSKHMTGDRSRLRNFVKKFIGTVRFGNDHFGAIMGYGDYVIGDSVISRVYYVEGLGHNLFSVGQFCDSDLEVAFRKHTCFVRDLDGVDLIKGSRGTNLYTISVEDMMRSSPICLLSKASKNKSWLWHRRLNHLNFGTLNDLARKDLVRGLPRLKFEKDHLCSACQLGKSRKATHKPKTINTIMEVLHTLHMDLCELLRVQSINGKKYILVIVDDYSRFRWVKFLRTKDETPAFVINLLKQLQVGLNKTVRFVQTDNGTEFINKALTDYYESVSITHEKTIPRTPQQNGVVEQRNHTLVEAAQTMLIFSKAPLFLWVEAMATACYTKNRSLIHTLHNKTPYELEGLQNLEQTDPTIMETIHVTFEELTEQTTPVHSSPGPAPNLLTPGPISSGLVPNHPPAAPYILPTNKELEILFQLMFDKYFESSTVDRLVPPAPAAQAPVNPPGPLVSIPIDQEAPSGSHSPSSSDHQSSSVHQGVAAEHLFEVNPFAAADPEPFVNVFTLDHNFEASSSRELVPPPDCAMIIALKWIYKVKLDEYGDVLKNKARLVAKGYRKNFSIERPELQCCRFLLGCCINKEISDYAERLWKNLLVYPLIHQMTRWKSGSSYGGKEERTTLVPAKPHGKEKKVGLWTPLEAPSPAIRLKAAVRFEDEEADHYAKKGYERKLKRDALPSTRGPLYIGGDQRNPKPWNISTTSQRCILPIAELSGLVFPIANAEAQKRNARVENNNPGDGWRVSKKPIKFMWFHARTKPWIHMRLAESLKLSQPNTEHMDEGIFLHMAYTKG